MNYLIDPMVFYLISVLSNLSFVFGMLLFLVLVALLLFSIILILYLINDYNFSEESVEEMFSKIKKIKKRYFVIPIVIITLLAIIIPSEETMTKMLVASQLNEQNYTMAKEEIIELIDYISEKIDN
jgi:uncharacterized membrane protein YozB (DUF420 family)